MYRSFVSDQLLTQIHFKKYTVQKCANLTGCYLGQELLCRSLYTYTTDLPRLIKFKINSPFLLSGKCFLSVSPLSVLYTRIQYRTV